MKWFVVILLMTSAMAGDSAAQTGSGIIGCDLSECIERALYNHPALLASQARTQAAADRLGQFSAETKPTLQLTTETTYLDGQAITPFAALGGLATRPVSGLVYVAGIGFELPIVKEGALLGRTPTAVRRARLLVKRQDVLTVAQRREVAAGVTRSYYEILRHQDAIPIRERIVEARESILSELTVRQQRDLIAVQDLLEERDALARAQRDMGLAELSLIRSRNRLALDIGVSGDSDIRVEAVPESTEMPPLPELLAAIERAPEIQALQLRMESRRQTLVGIRKELLPEVGLRVGYSLADDFNLPVNDQWRATLGIRVPLLDFGARAARIRETQAEHTVDLYGLQELRLDLETRLRDLHHEGRRVTLELDSLEALEVQAERLVQVQRVLDEQGLATPRESLDAEVKLLELKLERSEKQFEQQLAAAQLRIFGGEIDVAPAGAPFPRLRGANE